jgi:O-6-methylguanine DNA methyltransferase
METGPVAISVFDSDMGWIGLAVSNETGQAAMTCILLGQPSREAAERVLASQARSKSVAEGAARAPELAPLLEEAQAQMLEFLAGKRRELTVPIDLSQGTVFQRRVWKTIQHIPYGGLRSYKWVATRVGGPQYARAVGLALGANPIPIIVPCHRVVAQDGSLGGFSCGLGIKRRLLCLEGTLDQVTENR